MGDLDPHLTRGSLGPPESHHKRHHNRFSCFCRGSRLRQSDRQTDHATQSVTIGHICIVVRCDLLISCAVL